MKRLSVALLLYLGLASAALAQAVTNPSPVGDAGAYNTSIPTCTAGQFCFLQTDINGNLKTTGGGSTPGTGSQPYNYTAVAGAQYGLTIAASTALTVPATALQAQVCVSGNSVKYTYDSTIPTASVGLPLAVGQCIQFSGKTLLTALLFIQIAATATLDVGYTK